MARFQFKLQPVLRQRQIIEDQRRRDMAEVLRRKTQLLDQLREFQQTISASKQDLGGSLVGRIDMDRVSQFARFSSQAGLRARQVVGALAVVEQQVQAARARLVEASRARKAMELLRDRYREQWQREQDRRETATLDEIAVQGHARRLAAMDEEVRA